MKRDKEKFAAKNRDESYIKDKHPDVQLGRHTDIVQNKPTSQSKKNRMYQARQEPQTKTAAVNPETPYAADMQTELSESEPQEEFSEAAELKQPETDRDIPKSEQPKQTAKAKRQLYHKRTQNAQKSADLEIPQTVEKSETAMQSPPSKTDDYNIRDVVRTAKRNFQKTRILTFRKLLQIGTVILLSTGCRLPISLRSRKLPNKASKNSGFTAGTVNKLKLQILIPKQRNPLTAARNPNRSRPQMFPLTV